ncbi:hydrogenase nickel incorporation protein HypB, partial [Candidatus Poribacteria bacterium]|nr:hydrogenase nickel incorporation protein HypB [Candidatus Poribacteria bacterium]
INHTAKQMQLDDTDILFIENVGNLVCPASFDLGTDFSIVLLSTTEGDDKPLKYPRMFDISKALIINKIDLLPYVDCDTQKIKDGALKINTELEIFEVSCKTGIGLDKWYTWLKDKLEAKRIEDKS